VKVLVDTGVISATDFLVGDSRIQELKWGDGVARTYDQLATALAEAKKQPRTSVVVVETDYNDRVPGYDSWWDVPIAEVSESKAVQEARAAYIEAAKRERYFWPAGSATQTIAPEPGSDLSSRSKRSEVEEPAVPALGRKGP